MSNPTGKGGFQERKHHINKKGRPRSFDTLRGLTLDMFSRPAKDDNGSPIVIEGKPVTMIEFVIWKMIRSKDPHEIIYAVQVAYGKVPDKLELTGEDGGRIKIEAYDYNNAIAVITGGPGPDSETPS
jgi:hypothetical protein